MQAMDGAPSSYSRAHVAWGLIRFGEWCRRFVHPEGHHPLLSHFGTCSLFIHIVSISGTIFRLSWSLRIPVTKFQVLKWNALVMLESIDLPLHMFVLVCVILGVVF